MCLDTREPQAGTTEGQTVNKKKRGGRCRPQRHPHTGQLLFSRDDNAVLWPTDTPSTRKPVRIQAVQLWEESHLYQKLR